jgi:2-iminobutanoate/2-iminopropanoate deaminase
MSKVKITNKHMLTTLLTHTQAAGCTYKNVVKTSVFLTDISHFARVNEIYKEFFPDSYPARAAYQVPLRLEQDH